MDWMKMKMEEGVWHAELSSPYEPSQDSEIDYRL